MNKSFVFSMGCKMIVSCHGLAWQSAAFGANGSIDRIIFPQSSHFSEDCHGFNRGMPPSFSQDGGSLQPSIGVGFRLVCHGCHTLLLQIIQKGRRVEVGIYVVRGLAKMEKTVATVAEIKWRGTTHPTRFGALHGYG